jgi:hypothetical protein
MQRADGGLGLLELPLTQIAAFARHTVDPVTERIKRFGEYPIDGLTDRRKRSTHISSCSHAASPPKRHDVTRSRTGAALACAAESGSNSGPQQLEDFCRSSFSTL